MEKDKDSESGVFSLLQPELLSESELKEILMKRCVAKNLVSYSKNELVELFRKVALPLPQREYNNSSWRQKLLAKKQMRAKRRTISISSPESSSTKSETTNKIRKLSNENASGSQDRLKPPPDLNNRKRRHIIHINGVNEESVKKLYISSENKTREQDNIELAKNDSLPQEERRCHLFFKKVSGSIKDKKVEDATKKEEETKREKETNKEEKDESSAKTKRKKIVIAW